MTTQNEAIGTTRRDGAATLSARPQLIDRASNHYAAWLDQASKVREMAFRLAYERVTSDVEPAAQIVGCNDPSALAFQAECLTKLTADYLAENERMFELLSKLVQGGQVESL